VLITKDSEDWADIAVPAVVADDLEGVLCGYHLALVRSRDLIHGPFLSRAFRASGPRHQFHAAANGITRFALGMDAIASSVFPVPPPGEQKAIAAFLDLAATRIDALIAKKERLIELLQEKRAALITRAVTKGLDPNVPMKDSGIEWLGEIPAHWRVTRVKFLARRIVDGVHHTPEYVDEGVPFVTVRNLTATTDGISLDEAKFVSWEDHTRFCARARPERGDLLITKDGTLGVPRVVDTDRHFSIFVSVALLKPESIIVDVGFLRWAFEARPTKEQSQVRRLGSALLHLHLEQIAELVVALPPLHEQQRLREKLEEGLGRISALERRVQEAIEWPREYRAGLISAAVTGKIDVQGEASAGQGVGRSS